ncbi:uncharacterized protein LY89DRAFT_678007 [Mollisia scopiformis]|uniref:Uncharacterized protein n=1 Tax=Mollisia scopiformis TaxID=149040 RepID=A0A132B4R8_MOLSC|nr:uncharacterized protein LY89DRAFT_678007 [Mollisia scopiformis]KUJ07405.1 hypothetical protein LY89DRAFT_678007 [Mollisia scopiformis]
MSMLPIIQPHHILSLSKKSSISRRADGATSEDLDYDDDLDKARAEGQAEGASGEVDTGRIELDASLHNSLPTSELASAPTDSIDTSSPCPGTWVSLAAQRAFCSRTSRWQPLQDQTHQQGVGSITGSTSVESALHSLPKSSDSSDDGWTDENMAELEKELGLALGEQQVESSSARTPISPSPRRPRHHRTRSRVENAAKPLVVDQKSCEMIVDVVP